MMLQVFAFAAATQCVCNDRSLCQPLTTPPAKTEVVAFSPVQDGWKGYNMTSLTTIVKFGERVDPVVVCEAHKVGVRVVINRGFDKTQLGNETYIAAFIAATRTEVKEKGFDGYNFDIEGSQTGRDQLTSLVERLAAALRADNPVAQVTFDTPINASASSAGYDYVALSKTLDFFIPMGYDMCWGSRTPKPNSPMSGLLAGLSDYAKMGLLDKVVLGLPWYGYAWPCDAPSPARGGGCASSEPFSGSWSHRFDDAVYLEQNATTPPAYTAAQDARYFKYEQAGKTYELYYDDAHTLSTKYALVGSHGLRGAAFWYAGCAVLSSYGTPQAAAMWKAVEGIKRV